MAIYYGTQFLSRIIEDDNIRPLAEFGIKEKDFLTQAEKKLIYSSNNIMIDMVNAPMQKPL